jgi:hypothetical protein
MPDVFRVSLVSMAFASVIRRSQTPIPFMELRAFCFLDKIPNPTQELRIKRALKEAIENDLMHDFLGHIFESGQQDQSFSFLSRQTAKPISLKQITNRFRIEIEGYEVEHIDLDEIMHEQIYWSESPIQGNIDHHFFKFDRVQGGMKLHLNTNQVYRYCAFYNEQGDIDGEYDEISIRQYVQQRTVAIQQRQAFYQKSLGIITDIDVKTDELTRAIKDIEDANKRLRGGRF